MSDPARLTLKALRQQGLAPVDLELAPGECVALMGPSGAGKSLLMRALADLDPNEGDVTLDGRSRSELPAPEWRRNVAYLPAESGWWADRVGAHFPDRTVAVEMIDQLGFEAAALDWEVARLSTGERQRLALARSLQGEPRVLLLDEPSAALDAAASQLVEELLRKQLADGVSILLVTHDIEQARRLARRLYRMADGQLSPAPLEEDVEP